VTVGSMSSCSPALFYSISSKQGIYEEALKELGSLDNTRRIIFLRGALMTNYNAMCSEISAALQFPYYFGFNSAAIVDCLSDLAWMPATSYSLVIYDSMRLFSEESVWEFRGFLSDILEISRRWREGLSGPTVTGQAATRFSLLFQIDSKEENAFLARLTNAGIGSNEVRKLDLDSGRRNSIP
jgi:hypothetical protein